MSNIKKFLIPVSSVFIGVAISVVAIRASPVLQSKIIGVATKDSSQKKSQKKLRKKSACDDVFKKQESGKDTFDSLLDEYFFNDSSPFDSMRKMRDDMEEHLGGWGARNFFTRKPFDDLLSDKFGTDVIEDVSTREDAENIYYDVSVSNINSTSVKTKVESGYITISGEIEKSKNADLDNLHHSKQTYKSSFSHSFPLPGNVDENKMETLIDGSRVVIKFPKISL